jgi:hypothetical protein
MSDNKLVISDEAVEAAAKAFIEHGTLLEALEAAAPFIAAQVWDEAAASIIDEHGNPIKPTNVTNPYRSQA